MKGLLAAVAAIGLSSSAFAGVWQFTSNNLAASGIDENAAAGKASFVNTTFDPASKMFTWDVKFSDGASKDTDGFWLVVGPGPNPKGSAFEYAIMYFDGSSLANPNVTIYRYDGANADTSFTNPAELLGSSRAPGQTTIQNIAATQSGGQREFSFKVNAAAINSLYNAGNGHPDWQGIQFADKIGIWFHPVSGLSTSYYANNDPTPSKRNGLKTFTYETQGWYDGDNNETKMIPAPGAGAILGIGGLLIARRRRVA